MGRQIGNAHDSEENLPILKECGVVLLVWPPWSLLDFICKCYGAFEFRKLHVIAVLT